MSVRLIGSMLYRGTALSAVQNLQHVFRNRPHATPVSLRWIDWLPGLGALWHRAAVGTWSRASWDPPEQASIGTGNAENDGTSARAERVSQSLFNFHKDK